MQGHTMVIDFTSKRDLVMSIPILFGMIDFETKSFHFFFFFGLSKYGDLHLGHNRTSGILGIH
jgi:hypothetical protein